MLKKVCAILCLVAIVCAAFVGIAMTAGAEEATMQAGYARVDINPYVVDGDPSSGIMALPLAGTGDVWNRLSRNALMDDNGDGKVDENDGLKATVIAVTDKDGDAVLLITVDVMAMNFSSRINDEIMTRLEAEQAEGRLTDVKLVKENIYSASTHTHNAPDTTSYSSSGRTGTNNAGQDIGKLNEDLGLWISRTVEDIGDAAIMALEDRAATTITKDQLSAAAATSKAVKGKTMTMTRHYVVEQNGETFVAGDNFNGTSGTTTARGNDPQQVTEADDNVYILNFAFKDSGKLPIILTNWRGHPSLNNSDGYEASSKTLISSDYVSAFRHALEYGVDVQIDETNNIGNVTDWTLGNTQKYRVAFFNGTGGNTNPRGYELVRDANGNVVKNSDNGTVIGYSWIDKSGTTAPVKNCGSGYGVVLATFVNECITDGKQETVARAGEITSLSKTFKAEGKTVGCSQIAYDAGKAYSEALSLYNAADATYGTAKTAYYAYEEAQNKVDKAGFLASVLGYTSARDKAKTAYQEAMAAHNATVEAYEAYMTGHTNMKAINTYEGTSYATFPKQPVWSHPWIYKTAEGETFVIGSKYHASYVVGDWNNNLGIPANNGFNVTVSAFMIGEDIAFVSIPGEPFDYYFKERGVYTPENNMWNDLLGDTYGKPYILGYTNGWQRYFANVEAYYYNEGSATKTFASYEVHNSDMEAGTGERAITELGGLLTALNSETRTAYCQYCKSDVQWQPYGAQTKLSTGHYYLCADCDVSSQLRFEENCIVCLDLNGFAIKGSGNRAFYLDDNKNETLNIFDSSKNQTGVVMGIGGEAGAGRSYGGGTIYIGPGCTVNLYGGTLQAMEKENYSCQTGTVIRARGAFNIYGGTVEGGKAAYFT
ncbi:MAG: hypothetical protein IKU07_05160 [Oscillospiraceae bacterium]|nr:hypothetical protein [Oscillospiraceae bacterium]